MMNMPKWEIQFPRLRRSTIGWLQNLPGVLLCIFVISVIEVFTAAGIFQVSTDTVDLGGITIRIAILMSLISVGMGLAALVGNRVAEELKSDPRPLWRGKALQARLISLALLLWPITTFAEALSYQKALGEWRSYSGSEAMKADQAIVTNPMNGEDMIRDARDRLDRATKPKSAKLDLGCWFAAAFIHGILMLAGGAFYRPLPETNAEAEIRIRAERDRCRAELEAEAQRISERQELARLKLEAKARGWGWLPSLPLGLQRA